MDAPSGRLFRCELVILYFPSDFVQASTGTSSTGLICGLSVLDNLLYNIKLSCLFEDLVNLLALCFLSVIPL